MNGTVLQIQNGAVALPSRLRARYKLDEGAALMLVDLGGVFVLSPTEALIPRLASELEQKRKAAGLSMADLLEGLDEQRRSYAKEKYGITASTPAYSSPARGRRRARRGRILNERR